MNEASRSPTRPQLPTQDDSGHALAITEKTLRAYNRDADSFWERTRDHDVEENRTTLLSAIEAEPPFSILDLGCGPGRDLRYFSALGHEAVGLEGATKFVAMARSQSGCEVLHQNFLNMNLPSTRFDGVFANASLFHVPTMHLPFVLDGIHRSLKPQGVLFTSIPHGNNEIRQHDGRFGVFYDLVEWRRLLDASAFSEICHYYRPDRKPRDQQPWLASLWKKQQL